MGEQEPKRKIALVGTSCVGKTSVIEELKRRHKNNTEVAFIEEAARIYFTQHSEIPVGFRFSFQPQSEIQALALELEKAAHELHAGRLISDRSVLDAAVYVDVYGDREGSSRLVEGVREWLPTYSGIVLLSPQGVVYQKDEVRQEDPAVRQRNHEGYLSLFMREGIQYELVGGSLAEKIQTVEAMLMQ